jgi:hypothetical protein
MSNVSYKLYLWKPFPYTNSTIYNFVAHDPRFIGQIDG